MTLPAARLWKPVALAALAATVVAVLGAVVTDLGPWYYRLHKPDWNPPDWLFGPAWTLIFAFAALAGALSWIRARDTDDKMLILGLFLVNAGLNTLWSVLFFRAHRPDWALYEVGLLWLSILALIVGLRRFSSSASWLLSPYLAWVSFAACLNFAIVQLN